MILDIYKIHSQIHQEKLERIKIVWQTVCGEFDKKKITRLLRCLKLNFCGVE